LRGNATVDDLLVGVVSWGNGCASTRYPGVYARISTEYDWIRETVCDGTAVGPICDGPTRLPTSTPTQIPTADFPTNIPTPTPTLTPTGEPTQDFPTENPSLNPTTRDPTTGTVSPTRSPSVSPTEFEPPSMDDFPPSYTGGDDEFAPTLWSDDVYTPTFDDVYTPTSPNFPGGDDEFAPTYLGSEPTNVPSPEPTNVPSPEPTNVPSPEPTNVPSPEPTNVPSPEPTNVPSPEPTNVPSPEPTNVPSPEPTNLPTPPEPIRRSTPHQPLQTTFSDGKTSYGNLFNIRTEWTPLEITGLTIHAYHWMRQKNTAKVYACVGASYEVCNQNGFETEDANGGGGGERKKRRVRRLADAEDESKEYLRRRTQGGKQVFTDKQVCERKTVDGCEACVTTLLTKTVSFCHWYSENKEGPICAVGAQDGMGEGRDVCVDIAHFGEDTPNDVGSEDGDVVLSYSKDDISIEITASKDNQSITISQQVDEENKISPTISRSGDFSVEWERDLGDDNSVTTTLKPNDSVNVEWSDGAWTANVNVPIDGTDITGTNVGIKRDVAF